MVYSLIQPIRRRLVSFWHDVKYVALVESSFARRLGEKMTNMLKSETKGKSLFQKGKGHANIKNSDLFDCKVFFSLRVYLFWCLHQLENWSYNWQWPQSFFSDFSDFSIPRNPFLLGQSCQSLTTIQWWSASKFLCGWGLLGSGEFVCSLISMKHGRISLKQGRLSSSRKTLHVSKQTHRTSFLQLLGV